jgi:hypothetical protein
MISMTAVFASSRIPIAMEIPSAPANLWMSLKHWFTWNMAEFTVCGAPNTQWAAG